MRLAQHCPNSGRRRSPRHVLHPARREDCHRADRKARSVEHQRRGDADRRDENAAQRRPKQTRHAYDER